MYIFEIMTTIGLILATGTLYLALSQSGIYGWRTRDYIILGFVMFALVRCSIIRLLEVFICLIPN